MMTEAQTLPLTGETILATLQAHAAELREEFGVRQIGLFGSYVRAEAQPNSDIDILVELEAPTFDGYMDLKFYLEDLLGREVDLVMADSVKPRLKPHIAREVQHVPELWPVS